MSTSQVAAAPRDETIESADGTPLKAWWWAREPAAESRGVLVISHGLGEHGACYHHAAEVLGPGLGIDILAFDYRGHGRSPGRRGLVRRYDELVADLHAALDWSAHRRPGRPRFVLGHSNGGLVALRALLAGQDRFAGLILSNPALALARPVPAHKRLAGAVLRRVAPWVTLATEVGSELMTRDPEMLAEREGDPLRHTRISAPIFYGMVEGGPEVIAQAGAIRTPVLILIGAADAVTSGDATRALYDRLGSADKTLRVYPDALHEPLNDLGREQVLADISGWLSDRLPARPPLQPA